MARVSPNHNWPQALRLCSGPHSTDLHALLAMLPPIKHNKAIWPSHHNSPSISRTPLDLSTPTPSPDDPRCCQLLLQPLPPPGETEGLSHLRPVRHHRATAHCSLQTLWWLRTYRLLTLDPLVVLTLPFLIQMTTQYCVSTLRSTLHRARTMF